MRNSIILTAPEVAALLAGATQLRVPVRLPKWASTMFQWRNEWLEVMRNYGLEPPVWEPVPCPYRAGSVIAVREPWAAVSTDTRWRSPATMPLWAARLHLRVLEVWPQRVSDITQEEARACGAYPHGAPFSEAELTWTYGETSQERYQHAWRKRHGSAEWAWALRVERTEVG